MFVRKVKKPNGHVSVRVVRSERTGSRVRQKTVCCVGHCHGDDKDQIAFLHQMGRNIVREIQFKDQQELFASQEVKEHAGGKEKKEGGRRLSGPLPLPPASPDMVHAPSLKEKRRKTVGISDIFGKIYDDLAVSECLKGYKKKEVCRLLKEIVLHRLDQALSKRGSVLEIRKREDDSSMQLDRVYRMMDKIYKSKEALKAKVCERTLSLFKERVDIVFFDVTTLYFESFVEDDLRKCGFSKDNKVKETQVVLALMTSKEGLPVGYELFPGNAFEGKALLRTIDNVSKNYDIKDMFLAADRGMFSKKNLLELEKRGVQFVVGARLKSFKKGLKEKILTQAPAFKRGFRKARRWTGEFEWEGFRLIVHYDRERAEKDKKDREKILEKIKAKMKGDPGQVLWKDLVSNRGVKKYLKRKEQKDRLRSEDIAVLDKDKIQADHLYDGFSAVASNNRSLPAQDILSRYRNLWQIEAAFRLNKHDLKMRPIYHWTPKRIKAHILICFIAYGLAVFARHHLKRSNIHLSFDSLRKELKKVQVSLIHDTSTGKQFLLPSKIHPTAKAVYKAFNTPFPQTVQFL